MKVCLIFVPVVTKEISNMFKNGISWQCSWCMLQVSAEELRVVRAFVVGAAFGIYLSIIF